MIPLRKLFEYLEMMLAEAWGYIWGTAGILCTQAVIDRAANNPNNPNPEVTEKYGQKWLGKIVSDCSGIIVWIWAIFGLKIPHGSSSMVKQGYIVDCGSTPHPGWAALVDPTPDTPDNNHIGIVSEDGQYVYECKGTRYGFVKTPLAGSKFNKFGRFREVDYGDKPEMKTPYTARVNTQNDPLNVRSGPGKEYDKIGTIPKDAVIKVINHNEYLWDFVEYQGKQGYVKTTYLLPIEEIQGEPVPDLEPNHGEGVTTLVNPDGFELQIVGTWRVVE